MSRLRGTAKRRAVAVLGPHGTFLASLGEGARRLGRTVVRAADPAEAMLRCRERGVRLSTTLLSVDLADDPDLEAALGELKVRAGQPGLETVAVGPACDAETREKLQRAGVQLALWTPFGSHALRFQLNRALSTPRSSFLRTDERVPTEWRTRAYCAGRRKDIRVYSLSAGGAFLSTARPWVVGSPLAIELPLRSGGLTVTGEVVYTNVPGNLRRTGLPHGMAIQFEPMDDGSERVIRRNVAESALALRI